MILRSEVGSSRPVALCARCRRARPGHVRGELVVEDRIRAVVEREVAMLRRDYEAGLWLPYRDELHGAQHPGATTWTQNIVEHVPQLLALVDDRDPALGSSRLLLDVLAAGPA
ncbi:hypothetical protein [Embleya sp. MST-111070]|uniref:hypothetical protein n=1 Tax=Embleya sp. MST-111070 TaxID=3398231 RepID=UPI003F737A54